eukprot:1183631-Prorocentrum_minimum.AAC.6
MEARSPATAFRSVWQYSSRHSRYRFFQRPIISGSRISRTDPVSNSRCAVRKKALISDKHAKDRSQQKIAISLRW